MTRVEAERHIFPSTISHDGTRQVELEEPARTDSCGDYDRARDLPKIIALWPVELRDFSPAGTRKIIGRLQNALRAERGRGRLGHWSYDLERHLALLRAFKSETALLERNAGRHHISA